jgi:site-specific DNA-methyltransferase (cytosine-N4-specific)
MLGPAAYLREHGAAIAARLDAIDRRPRVIVGTSEKMDLPDASVQLIVTSPPYPMIEMWDALFEEWTGRKPADPLFYRDCHKVLDRVWRECARVLAEGGIAAVNVGDAVRTVGDQPFRLYANHVDVHEGLARAGLLPLVPILWKKPTNKPNAFLGSGFLPPNAYVTLDCEYVLLFRKGAPRAFPPKDPLRYASEISKAERDAWFTQVWQLKGARQLSDDVERRTGAFPLEVPERLVRMFSVLGDVVLDPFAGTGTTLRAATRWGRRAVGFEVEGELTRALGGIEVPTGAGVLERILAAY